MNLQRLLLNYLEKGTKSQKKMAEECIALIAAESNDKYKHELASGMLAGVADLINDKPLRLTRTYFNKKEEFIGGETGDVVHKEGGIYASLNRVMKGTKYVLTYIQ